jgi:hypothetical protein
LFDRSPITTSSSSWFDWVRSNPYPAFALLKILVLLLEFVRLSLTDPAGFCAFDNGVCLLSLRLGNFPRAEPTVKFYNRKDLT